jgi:hypothetical protein
VDDPHIFELELGVDGVHDPVPQSHEKEFGLHPIYAYRQAELNGYHSPEIVA